MSMPGSYEPSTSKYLRLIANKPPAIVGDRIGSVFCLRRFISLRGTGCQSKIRFQSKPPTCTDSMGVLYNWNVLSSMISMRGTVDTLGLRAIGSISGSSQPSAHSQCESKKTRTSPVATAAPFSRALIKPSRFFTRTCYKEIESFFLDCNFDCNFVSTVKQGKRTPLDIIYDQTTRVVRLPFFRVIAITITILF